MSKTATPSLALILLMTSVTLRAEVTIPYSVPRGGRVSLALYDAEGRMVRTLLTGKPHAKGDCAATWDGLDRYGNALPAGDYTWRLLATEGLRAEFITQVGQNVDPAWERATGNHAPPNSVAVDATGLYRVGATNEGAHWGVKTNLDGRHLWTNDRWSADPWVQDTVAVTLVGDRLFELMPNGHVYGYDAKSGRVFTGGDFDPKPWNLRWNRVEPPAGGKDENRRKLNAAESPRDLAGDAASGLLVAAFPQHDAIAWFSAKDGQLVDTATNITGLAGVAVAKEGTVFAISGGEVVAFSREDKTPRIVIAAEKLQCPWRLCVSPQSGDVFVAENSDLAKGTVVPVLLDASDGKVPDLGAGARVTPVPGLRHHQVKRFAADGTLVKCFDRREGRDDGVYAPTDFRGLTDIEADADGGFVVTEGNHTPPRRVARFDADGNPLREWYGAQHYGVIACPEPGDPRFVWTLANAPQPGLVRWEVDYAKKTWRVAEVYQEAFAANKFATVPPVPNVFEKDGRIYIQGGGVQPVGWTLCVYDPVAKRIRPCNASESRDNKRRAYLWNDLNDDGLATDDEVQWLSRNKLGGWIHPGDFTLRTTSTASDYSPGPLLKPVRITAGGTPVYDMQAAEQSAPWLEHGRKHFPGDFRVAADGSVFACFSDGASNPHEGMETHGAWYYNSCSAIDRLVKWSREGKPLWSVGRHTPDKTAITADIFSARWSGTYEAATSEDTRFEIRGSFPWRAQGQPLWSRLWLGGELVFDSKPSGVQGQTTYDQQAASSLGTVAVKLRAGQRLDLRLECGFKKGQAALALSHDTPGLDRRVILPEFLHPEPGPKAKLERVTEQRPEVIAHFDFDEVDGMLSWSRAGGDVFGRLTGGTRRVAGKTGRAVELAAKGEFDPALFPIDEELRLPVTDYTVGFWFKTTASNVRLCEAKRYSSYNNRWSDHIVSVEGGKLRFQLQGDGPLETSGPVNDGQWHHVVTTVAPGGQRLHVDGQRIATGKLAQRTRVSNRLGLDLGPGGGQGTVAIDDLSVFGRSLSEREIVAMKD